MAAKSNYCGQKNTYAPQSFTKDDYYEVKIENVYDPSKFWIIIKFQELSIFMKYLKSYYDKVENRNNILKNNLKKKLMCMVYKNGLYYRCVILPVMLPEENHVRVFMIDFGYIVNVFVANIFYIFEKHYNVPRFAIRACLAYVSPLEPSKTWNQSDLKAFCSIIGQRKIFVKTCEIDTARHILFVEIFAKSGHNTVSVSDQLVNSKVAVYNNSYKTSTLFKLNKYKSKVKYPHLFPSFEALESGIVPCSLWEHDLLKNIVPLDLLYADYYQYEENN